MSLYDLYQCDDNYSGKYSFGGQKVFFTFNTVLLILMTTSSFYLFFAGSRAGETGKAAVDNHAYLAVWFLLYGITGLSFVMQFFQKGLRQSFFIATPLVLWVFLSFVWSVSSERTLYFSAMFIMLVIMAYVTVETIKPEKFLRIFIYLFSFLLLVSLIGFYIFPEYTSSSRYGGGWIVNSEMNGVFSHKSDAGYFFACLIIAVIGARDMGLQWSWRVRTVIVALAFLGILFANSATGLMSALILTVLYLVVPNFENKKRLLSIFGVGILLFALLVPYLNIGHYATFLGRDANLTGRNEIWMNGVHFIDESLFWGYGYYGFFDENIFSPVWQLWNNFNYFLTPHFHNSGMDVTISLGLIGLSLYVMMLLRGFTVLYNTSIQGSVRLVLFLILVLFIMTSAFDFTLMKHNHFATFFMFYVFFLSFKQYDEEM